MEENVFYYPELNRTYYHYKNGGRYSVITLALDSETKEEKVVYKSIEFGTVYTRPLKEWSELMPSQNIEDERPVKRFSTRQEFNH